MDEQNIKEEPTGVKEEKKEEKGLKIHKIKKRITRTINIVILVLVILLSFFYIREIKAKEVPSFEHEAYSQTIGFKDVGELVTQTAYIRVVEDSSIDRKLFEDSIFPTIKVPFTKSRLIFSYVVQVDASISFEEIVVKEIDDEAKIVYLKLPHAKIYKQPTLDLTTHKVYLDDESLFSRIDAEKQNELLNDMKEKAKNEALANGILDNADSNGRLLIENLIKGNEKYKDYKVDYEYVEGD